MQHRLFLVPAAAGTPTAAAVRHWEERHSRVFAQTPGLMRYVQNRPLTEEWAAGRAWFCSETWFADRATERNAYASPYYRDVVTADEATFLDREAAWSGVVLTTDGDHHAADLTETPTKTQGWRVLWFGDEPAAELPWTQLPVTRTVPAGRGRTVFTTVISDRERALALTVGAPCPAFVCTPTTIDVPAPAGGERRGS